MESDEETALKGIATDDACYNKPLPSRWEPALQVQVINQLGKLTNLPDAVVPDLIKLSRHDRCRIRATAAANLGHFKNSADTIIPQLVLAQKDGYAEVRAAALESLLKFGINHPVIRSAVESAQQDQHPYLKLLAAEALRN